MSERLSIWLLNPYHTGSHRAWAEGYAAHSRHRVKILAMDGRFWKWRMQGGSLELAQQAEQLAESSGRPDLIVATSMVNLPAFYALLRRRIAGVPSVLYMHENQLTYPPPPGSKRDLTYGMIQHLSMLAADRVCFNSAYHLKCWYEELPRLLKHFPDYTHQETIGTARAKSQVLPVGCDLAKYDQYRPAANLPGPPLILWNQRWEYDKDPGTMLRALYTLAEEGAEFQVALAGANFRIMPAEFAEAREKLGGRLVHYGYIAEEADYARMLWTAGVVLSTAIHEFFGVSIVEALYCDCTPVLPNRLSYPELLPPSAHAACLYTDFGELVDRLRSALHRGGRSATLHEAAARFDWSVQAGRYDELMQGVARGDS